MRNHLTTITRPLRNRYVALRHGISEANELGIISCAPNDQSGFKHGLSQKGLEQAENSFVQLNTIFPYVSDYISRDQLFIYSSDFKRTQETAQGLCRGLGLDVEDIILSESLRERSFGDFDLMEDNINYEKVWAADDAAEDATGGMVEEGVESVMSVQDRSTRFIAELEDEHVDDLIVIVGHGECVLKLLFWRFFGDHKIFIYMYICQLSILHTYINIYFHGLSYYCIFFLQQVIYYKFYKLDF